MNPPLHVQVLQAAAARGYPEIPAQASTGYCWLSGGPNAWQRAVRGTSPSVLRLWLAALTRLEAQP